MLSLLVIFVAIAVSLAHRVREKRRTQAHEYPEHARPSPLSEAIQELIAMAGGIYISLLLLVSFLQLDLPDKLELYGLEINLLAFASILLAIIQPFTLTVMQNIRKGSR